MKSRFIGKFLFRNFKNIIELNLVGILTVPLARTIPLTGGLTFFILNLTVHFFATSNC